MVKAHQTFLRNGGGHLSASVLLLDTYLVLSHLLHMKKNNRGSICQPTTYRIREKCSEIEPLHFTSPYIYDKIIKTPINGT